MGALTGAFGAGGQQNMNNQGGFGGAPPQGGAGGFMGALTGAFTGGNQQQGFQGQQQGGFGGQPQGGFGGQPGGPTPGYAPTFNNPTQAGFGVLQEIGEGDMSGAINAAFQYYRLSKNPSTAGNGGFNNMPQQGFGGQQGFNGQAGFNGQQQGGFQGQGGFNGQQQGGFQGQQQGGSGGFMGGLLNKFAGN